MENTVNVLMGVKNVSVSYQINDGTVLPGYLESTSILGASPNMAAPGFGFLFGQQDTAFGMDAARNGWITSDSILNSPFLMTHSETFNFRASIEPVVGMRIDITAVRTYTNNNTSYIYYDPYKETFYPDNKVQNGNFTMSFNTWGTAFEKMGDNDYFSQSFQDFKDNRIIIANRLAENRRGFQKYDPDANRDSEGFPNGYGSTSQDVVMPALLAAYSGKSANKISLDKFPSLSSIKPNWRISYDGLSQVKFFKQYFKKISLNHSYRSTYSISSYRTDTRWQDDGRGFTSIRDQLTNANYVPEYEIGAVNISETFSPLFNIDMSWKNSLITKLEVKKNRNLTFSFANNQLTEVRGNEYIIELDTVFLELNLKLVVKS